LTLTKKKQLMECLKDSVSNRRDAALDDNGGAK
jgi:hypothetical protein